MDKNSKWMFISGLVGFSVFLIVNYTNLFAGVSILAGYFQLAINAFVFVAWGKAFVQRRGLKKAFPFLGTLVPLVTAATTIVRVLIPSVV